MATFYLPIENKRAGLTTKQRWFFLVVEATDPCDATCKGNREARSFNIPGASVWAAQRECPTAEYMQALSDGLAKSRGKSPRTRTRIVAQELARMVPA